MTLTQTVKNVSAKSNPLTGGRIPYTGNNGIGVPAAAGREEQLEAQRRQEVGVGTHASLITGSTEEFTLATAMRNDQPALGTLSTITKTKFGYASESLPFVETVSPVMRKAIIDGKDINLSQLLLPTNNAITIKDKEDKLEKDTCLFKNLSIAEFIYAFGIYKNIMCKAYPQRHEELDLYERDIVEMANRYGGKVFTNIIKPSLLEPPLM